MVQQWVEGKRARRRRVSEAVAKRRWGEYQRMTAWWRSNGEGYTPRNTDRPFGCRCCQKRKHGAPRQDCGMCDVGKRRRVYGWRREAQGLQAAVRSGRPLEDVVEPEARRWPTGKDSPKLFGIERRGLAADGRPSSPWVAHGRRYRTPEGRACALRSLQLGVVRRRDGSPRYELRAAAVESDG